MNQMHRNLYKALYRKCRYIDNNPALKNTFMLPPSHLFSLQQGAIDRINNGGIIQDATTNFINCINNGGEYFSPGSKYSMTSILHNFVSHNKTNHTQSGFNGLKLLNNAERFSPYLSDESYKKYQIRRAMSIINKPRLETPKVLHTMNKLDKDLLLRGGIGFIQHPFALDYDVNQNQKPFETKQVMIGIKGELSPNKNITILLTLNKPLNERMSSFHDPKNAYIPPVLLSNDAFYGGRNLMAYNTLTINPNCGGIPIMNGNLFLNPDMDKAEKLIKKGDAVVGDFRFLVGFEAFYDEHLENVMQRNKYIAVNLVNFGDDELLLDTIWNNQELVKKKYIRNDLWDRMVGLMGDEFAESWLKWREDMYDSEQFYDLCRDHFENLNTQLKECNKLIEHYVM